MSAIETDHDDDPYDITPEIALHVLWFFDRGGYEPGSFARSLLKTIHLADAGNRTRLSLAFPGYTTAFQIASEDAHGIDILTEIAYPNITENT